MALQDILASIEEETAKKMAEQERRLKIQMEEIDSVFSDKTAELEKSYARKVEEKLDYLTKKVHSHVSSQRKMRTLSKKHTILDAVFEESLARLVNSKKYTALLTEMFKSIDMEKGEVIYAKGKKAETEEAIKKAGKNFELKKEGGFKGGAKVITPKAEFDFSFENLMTEVKVAQESEIANVLFNA